MAFRQPQQRPQPLRPTSQPIPANEPQVPASPSRKRPLDQSEDWILFSPTQNDRQSQSSQAPRTATQPSDFGSLETHVRSQPISGSQDADLTCRGTELDDDDDNAELDSLDDGLHAFHHPFSVSSNHLDHSGGAVLPTHDGFGTFPSSSGMQEQLWQYERHNPHRRRHVRRRSSVQKKLDAMDGEEQETNADDERTARIEKWRLEQSRAVLDEIEKETRRMRRRMSRMSNSTGLDLETVESRVARTMSRQQEPILEESEIPRDSTLEEEPQSESFWQRITRRVIEDLIGLDENTLSVIFGESLPEDASPTPTQPSPIAAAVSSDSRVAFHDRHHGWEMNLLNRIARELGVLVHQLSEHEGAFSTYQNPDTEAHQTETARPTPQLHQRRPSLQQQHRRRHSLDQTIPNDPIFHPTVPSDAPDSSLWGIEEESTPPTAPETQSREYWERTLDVNLIFTYLRRRLAPAFLQPNPPPPTTTTTTNQTSPETPAGPLPASWATSAAASNPLGTSPASLRRAAFLRSQHPLVSRASERAASRRRRDSLLRRHQVAALMRQRSGGSSCASQSRSTRTRGSWRGAGGSLGTGSGVGGWGFEGDDGSGGLGSGLWEEGGGWGEV